MCFRRRQCQRIADALAKGEVALAQIYGLHIPVSELSDRQLRCVAKADLNPDEPRIPKGNPRGGEWTTGDDSGLPSPKQSADGRDITFGHGFRHLRAGDTAEDVENAIGDSLAVTPLVPGFNSGAVIVNGGWYQYRAFLRPDGSIHVGTYFSW